MNVNKPISRRKALKVMGLGMLAAYACSLRSDASVVWRVPKGK